MQPMISVYSQKTGASLDLPRPTRPGSNRKRTICARRHPLRKPGRLHLRSGSPTALAEAVSSLLHKALVLEAARWLDTFYSCSVVITEMSSAAGETPNAIGFSGYGSVLIQCLTSRAALLADKRKAHRAQATQFMGAGDFAMGNYRYYLAPKGVIAISEVPPDWGLLEVDSHVAGVGRIRITQEPNARRDDGDFKSREVSLLLSALRRIGQNPPEGISIRCYDIETERRATLGVLPLSNSKPQPQPQEIAP